MLNHHERAEPPSRHQNVRETVNNVIKKDFLLHHFHIFI